MKHVLLLAALLCGGLAHAADTFRVGSRVLSVGDTTSKLIEVAGKPVVQEPIETDAGGLKGERWQYQLDDKTVTFEIRDGKIAGIEGRHN